MHANRGELSRHGIIYPHFGRGPNHHGLLVTWVPQLATSYCLPDTTEAALAKLYDLHARSDATVVTSYEEFSRGQPNRRKWG